MTLSIVVPLYNEEDSLLEMYKRTVAEAAKLTKGFEILFIDDGSKDNSLKIIKELANKDSRVRVFSLRRNFGKATALTVGFQMAKNDYIITLDADLQDEPSEMHKFIKKLDQGYDMVSGWKKKRNDPLNKTLPTKLFNAVVSFLSGLKLHDFNCGFKAYTKDLAKQLDLYGEHHRFIPVIADSLGYSVTEVVYKHNPRKYGVSKYGISRFTKGLFDAITVTFLTRYRNRPLHFFGIFGLLLTFIGVIIGLYLTLQWFQGYSIGDRPLLILSVLLVILGTQFFSTGLLAELFTSNRVRLNINNLLKK